VTHLDQIAKRESLRKVYAVTDRLEVAVKRVEDAERRLLELHLDPSYSEAPR
jgi:hypothetical protein